MSEAGIYRPRDRWVGFTVNAIEWYDVALFAALASVLVVTLFPPGHDTDRLPLVFASSRPRSSLDRWGRFWSACGRIRRTSSALRGHGDPDVDGNGVDRVRADMGDRGCAVAHRSVLRSNRDYPQRVRPALSR